MRTWDDVPIPFLFKGQRRGDLNVLFQAVSLLLLAGVIASTLTISKNPASLASWDVLLLSGVLALMVGLRLASHTPSRLGRTLARLIDRGALQGSADQLNGLRTILQARASSWASRGGLVVAVFIAAAFAIVMIVTRSLDRAPLALFEVCGGYIAGWHLGRMAGYGGLGAALKAQRIEVRPTPGHLDGAAGLKPVGDFYFFQAMVAAIPSLYLAVWWFMIPLVTSVWPRYASWRSPYIALLALSIAFEVLAFLVPMWSFHLEMQQEKLSLLKKADELSANIGALEAQLAEPAHPDSRRELQEQLALMTKYYWNIENMPTWPVDYKTGRRFTLSNVGLLLPVAAELVKVTSVSQMLELVERLFT